MQKQTDQLLQSEFADELRTEGIFFKGYGIVPKYAMLDRDITIESKAIYAYFCSYSGAGNCAFPGRDKILADLRISKDAYYKHYNLLLENGYITVQQNRSSGSQFYKNIYTLVNTPAKFMSAPSEQYLQQPYGLIKASGLKAAGYGLIPKALMTDQRLCVKAKGLYAYYAAFTGGGESAFPEKSAIMSHLRIGIHVCEKLNHELLQFNYINVIQRHVNGRLSVNDVYLIDRPNTERADTTHSICKIQSNVQCSRIQDTDGEELMQSSKKQDTEKLDAAKQDTSKQDDKSNNNKKQQTTKINNKPKSNEEVNKFRSNRKKYHQLIGKEKTKNYTEKQKKQQNIIIAELLQTKTFPKTWLGDRRKIKPAIEILTDDEIYGIESTYSDLPNGQNAYEIFCIYRDSLIEMLSSQKPMHINHEEVSAQNVLQKLNKYITIDPDTGNIEIHDLYETVFSEYKYASEHEEIKYQKKYMRTCIWNAKTE